MNPSDTQHARLADYERWLARPSPSAIAMRWLMGPQGAYVINGPLLRLPDELQLTPDQRLLDIGCGRGSVLRAIDARVRFEVPPVGLDFSPAMLRFARDDNRGQARSLDLVRGSAATLPLADGAFDLVLCGYVVKHLDDDGLRNLLDEVWRVLAPGGLALLWEFAPTGRALLDGWNRRWLTTGVSDPHLRSTGTLLRLARDAGFPFARPANLRPFLLPPIPRASILVGRPPEGIDPDPAGQPER